MADALPLTSDQGQVVNLGLPTGASNGTPSSSIGERSQQPAGQQPQGELIAGVDPSKLPPEMQQLYRALQSDYTRKTQDVAEKAKAFETERTGWTTEKEKFTKMEQQFQDLNRRVQYYAQQEQNWKGWMPTLQRLSQPGVMERVSALLEGKEPTPAAQQQQVLNRLFNVGDEDVVDGKTLNEGLMQLRESMKSELMADWQKDYEQKLAQQNQAYQQWIEGYMNLADQIYRLNLQHQYGLTPKAGTEYDPMRVIQTAKQYGLPDLEAAYQLAYGQQQTQQAAAAAQTIAEAERKKIADDAYARALRDFELKQANANAGLMPVDSTVMPIMQRNAPMTYKEAENTLSKALAQASWARVNQQR